MDLITRRIIKEMEGDDKNVNLSAYSNPETPEYQEMVKRIGVQLNFTSLRYHRLDDLIESVGIEKSCVPIAGMGENRFTVFMALNRLSWVGFIKRHKK